MKKILLFFILLSPVFAFAQQGAQALSGVFFRVQDTVAYQSSAATRHSQGYKDIYFNDQATTKHWDIWNGSSYDHVFDFNSGGGLTAPVDATNIADGSVTNTEFQYINSLTSNAQTQIDSKISKLTAGRSIGSADAVVQSDNNAMLYLNGTFNLTIDALSQWTSIGLVNEGSGTITLVDGSGVTHTGGSSLASGETAVVHYKTSTGPVVFTGSSAGGDVVGPASATDNLVATFDGTTGKLLKSTTTPNIGTPSAATLTNATGLPISTGVSGLGTGVATWLATPSYTNFLSAITGTAPYYLTASGGTATAANTFTHNFENGRAFTSTFTATANNSYADTYGGTLTARATASDNLIYSRWNGTLVAAAATQNLILMDLQPTFTPGAFSPRTFAIRASTGDLLFGTNTPFATATTYQFQAASGVNNILRLTNSSGSTSHLFRADGALSIGNNLGVIALTDAGGLTESVTGTTFRFSNGASRNNTNDVQFLFLQSNDASTAATTHNVFRLTPASSNAFAPTSGSTNFRAFYLNPSINQTGTASGSITVFDIDPTETGVLGTYYSLLSRPVNARSGFATASPVSTLDIDGSLGMDITSTSTDLTLTHIHHTILVDASGASRTITLPAVSGVGRREYTIKKVDASGNAVTVDGNASETIDGATTFSLPSQWKYVTIQTDGTAWYVTANN